MTDKEDNEMTLLEAAEKLGVADSTLRSAIRIGRLLAKKRRPHPKSKPIWYVTDEALQRWQSTGIHKQGRPKRT